MTVVVSVSFDASGCLGFTACAAYWVDFADLVGSVGTDSKFDACWFGLADFDISVASARPQDKVALEQFQLTNYSLQIHITYNTPSSVTISWATGEGLQYASPVQSYQDSDGIMTEVYYGTQSGQYTLNATG